MLKSFLKMLYVPLLALSLNGCTTVPNVPICAELSISKGVCVYTATGDSFVVDDENPFEGQTWFDMRIKTLSVPAKSWSKIKAFLIKQCKKSNQCNVDISSWDRDLEK